MRQKLGIKMLEPHDSYTRDLRWMGNGVTSIAAICFTVTLCIAQNARVTFKVLPPPSTPGNATIFIVGNNSTLGEWDPGKVELSRLNDSVWFGQFAFERGHNLQYKITRGGWNVQAVYDNGAVPGNSRLIVRGDTEVVIRPVSWTDGMVKASGRITGTVRYHRALKGERLRYARDLIVWLPPSYEEKPSYRYPVLYMQDGQNIVDPGTSYAGYDWRVDEVADSLIREGKMQEIIIVGIYNSPDRMVEYSDSGLGMPYAEFVVHTVKQLIESVYRTKSDRLNTAVMGSSLGGLISFLLAWWYPDIFSKAGCLSSVFSYNDGKILKEVESESGPRREIKVYMDCGGYANEATLKPGMDKMIGLLRGKGYVEGKDFEYFYDASAEHSERAWAARVWRPLEFFFGN
jgi:predicted alpha/beta superfamily hydrolase